MICYKRTSRYLLVNRPRAARGYWCTAAFISWTVVAVLLAHRVMLAGGFVPLAGRSPLEPVILAEFRAPSAAALNRPAFATTAAQPASPPIITSRGFRAPEAGPNDEAAKPNSSALPVFTLPPSSLPASSLPASSLPASDPLGIHTAMAGPVLDNSVVEKLAIESLVVRPPGGGSLTGGLLASLPAVAATDREGPLFALPAGITRLPSFDDVSLPTDAVPTLADAPAEASSSEAATDEEVPTPDANSDGEVVEATEVEADASEEVEIEAEVIETYGWSYLGMWLGDRLTPHRIEAGGTYSSGTHKSWSALLKARWRVEADRYDDELTLDGVYTEVDDERSNNEWIARDTFDWKAPDGSPWRLFIKGHAEYDEIEKLTFRGTTSTGVGYAWLSEDDRKLTTRVGPSYTYERFFDPKDTNDKPELLAEVELKWTFFEALVLEHQTSAYPAFNADDGIRVNDETGLLTPIGTSPFWSWKLGLRHQYNNKPNTAVERNEFQASFMLVYDR